MADYPLVRADIGADIIIKEKTRLLRDFGLVAYLVDELHDVMAAVDLVASNVGLDNVWVDSQSTYRNGDPMKGKVGLYVRKHFFENSWDRYYRDIIDFHRWANKRIIDG